MNESMLQKPQPVEILRKKGAKTALGSDGASPTAPENAERAEYRAETR